MNPETSLCQSWNSRTASAKVQNASQAAKKRELDRLAQKKSRQRARTRLLQLEEKLRRLQDDDKQKQIADLMSTVDELRAENERLKGMHKKVLSLIRGLDVRPKDNSHEDPTNTASRQSKSPPALPDLYEQSPPGDTPNESQSCWDKAIFPRSDGASSKTDNPIADSTDDRDDLAIDLYTPSPAEILPSFDFSPSAYFTDFDIALSCGTPGQRCPDRSDLVVPDVEKWRTSNEAFILGIDACKQSIGMAKVINSHAAYKAILGGCDLKEEPEMNHPLWLALRQVDERVFGNWSRKAQKIAMMFVCHRMLLVGSAMDEELVMSVLTYSKHRSNPCPETLERVPAFLRPRPSQETIQHPAVIDFLIWPGLRDRLVFSHTRYTTTGEFSAAFCENLRFNWPFSNDDILAFDPSSSNYIISPLFEKYAFNMKNWTMDEGFFEKYREMRYDIPCSTWGQLEEWFDCMPMIA